MFISYMQKKMVAKDLLSDVNSACQDLNAGGLTWAKTTVILYVGAKNWAKKSGINQKSSSSGKYLVHQAIGGVFLPRSPVPYGF